MPRSEKKRSGVLSFLGITRWRLWKKDTWLCFVKTKRPGALLAKIAPDKIPRHAGDANEQVHLRPTDAESRCQSRLQSRRHLSQEYHPPQPVTRLELNVSKSLLFRPDMRIHIHQFHVLNYLPFIDLPRIASTIQIMIQICCLIKEHPLVSTLSAVWQCS